jgi:hypothetical protein
MTGGSAVLPDEPLLGELTGHIDLLMTFTVPTTLVLGDLRDPESPNRQSLDGLAAQFDL